MVNIPTELTETQLGTSLAEQLIWQVGGLRERRAVKHLEWLHDNCSKVLAAPASEVLERIPQEFWAEGKVAAVVRGSDVNWTYGFVQPELRNRLIEETA